MSLPKYDHRLVVGDKIDPVWLRYLQSLDGKASAADISAIATALGSPDGTVANIPPLTDSTVTILQSSGIQVTRDEAGAYVIALRPLGDSGEGAFKLITRDSTGRLSGTADGTAADVPYDNATSGLAATDVQAAVDEVAATVVGAGAWVTVKKTADESRNSTATPSDDSELSISLAATARYFIRGRLIFNMPNATMGYKPLFSYTGTLTTNCGRVRRSNAGNSDVVFSNSSTINGAISGLSFSGVAVVDFDLIAETGGAGNFSIQWAQSVSNASDLTLLAGSYFEYAVF